MELILPEISYLYNTTQSNDMKGFTPVELMFGRKPELEIISAGLDTLFPYLNV